MNTLRYSVPRAKVISGVSGLPVAPLRRYAMTARAALEENLFAMGEFRFRHRRRFGIDILVHGLVAER